MNFGQFADGVTLTDTSELVGYTPPAGVGVPYNRWTGLEIYTYINTKLNLGGAALLNVGTTAGTVAAGDDSRITGALQKANNLSDVANATTALTNILPSQAGQSGKVLTTNGTVQSWGAAGATGPVGTGNNSVTISNLQGNPDIDVGTGIDDEFVNNGSGVPTNWTAVPSGSPDTIDTTTNYSYLHMIANGGGGANALKGIYKAAPSFPFTMTAKLSDWTPWLTYGGSANQGAAGIFLAVSGASGAFLTLQGFSNSGGPYYYDLAVRKWTSRTNVSANEYDAGIHLTSRPPIYLRFVATSTTQITAWISYDGLTFTQLPLASSYNAFNPSITIAAVGLFVDGSDGTPVTTAFFDWVRFN